MKVFVYACCACALLSANSVLAQSTAKAEAGIVASRGNTDADSANIKADIELNFDKWKHQFGTTAVYASDDTGTTGQRWELREQSDYQFLVKGFWFESLRYENDRFSGFIYQATLSSGIGWRFYDDPITRLNAQVGIGYKQYETRDAFADDGVTIIPGEREHQLITTGQANFERVLTDTTKLIDKLVVEAGAENTFAQNDISLQVQILGSLALAVGVSVRYNTNPPAGFRNTDTLTTLNLVYERK
jgi:putative salt-induced outer membrane protein